MQARFGVVVLVLAAIVGIEVIVIVLGRNATPGDLLGGMLITVAGLSSALLVQALGRAAVRALGGGATLRMIVGAVLHTAVAAYAIWVVTGVDAPFGWLLGALFGVVIGASLPTFAFGPVNGWAAAVVAVRIAAFVGLALITSAPILSTL